MNLVFEWIKTNGGVCEMEKQAIKKSKILYEIIENSGNFYSCPINETCRSRTNVPFRVGGLNGNEELETQFLKEAEELSMYQLKGHRYVTFSRKIKHIAVLFYRRTVGGIRASLYNAVTYEDVELLIQFMRKFQVDNS